jgi:hypothetical protein
MLGSTQLFAWADNNIINIVNEIPRTLMILCSSSYT